MPTAASITKKVVWVAIMLLFCLISFQFLVNFDIDDSFMYYQKVNVTDSIHDQKKEPTYYRSKGLIGWLAGPAQMPEDMNGDSSNVEPRFFLAIPGYKVAPSYTNKERERLPQGVWWLADHSTKGVIEQGNIGAVLVPLSTGSYHRVQVIFSVLLVLTVTAGFLVVILLPIRIFKTFASDRPFSKQVVKHLFIIGWTLVGFTGLVLLISLVSRFILSDQIPPAFSFSYIDFFKESLLVLIAGFGTVLMGYVFRKGHEMEQKEALTV